MSSSGPSPSERSVEFKVNVGGEMVKCWFDPIGSLSFAYIRVDEVKKQEKTQWMKRMNEYDDVRTALALSKDTIGAQISSDGKSEQEMKERIADAVREFYKIRKSVSA